jgi:hypothetical protein
MRSMHRLKRCVRGAQGDFYSRRSMKGQAQPSGIKEGFAPASRSLHDGLK